MIFTFSTMSKSELEVRIVPKCFNVEQSCSEANAYHNLLTLQDVQAAVKHAAGDKAVVENFSLESYSDGKLGYLGSHLRLSVHVKTVSEKNTLSFFVKAVPYHVSTQAEYVLDKCVFLKEKIFYRDIVPQLYHEYKGEPWTATCFLAKENFLIFEDLGAKGYSLRSKLFDKQLLISGLTAIAKLQASCLLAEARLGKTFKEMYPQAFIENAFSKTGKTRKWFNVCVNTIVAVAEHLGLNASLIPKACEKMFLALEMSSTKRNVISHGDLWGNNLMFSNTVPPNCLLVDFQLIRYSPLAHDVVNFLYLTADSHFRATWEETMLKHYYSVLCETMNSTKSVSVEIPSWSELIEGIEEQRLGAIITAAMYFQTVLLDEKTSMEIMNDSAGYHEFVFNDRKKIVLDVMKIDPVYNKRLIEIVSELVEYSFRLDELPNPT